MRPTYLGNNPIPSLTVWQLTQHLSTLVRQDVILQDIWVRGEISNFSRAASGHLYFSLTDEQATLSCVMWRSAAQWLRFRPQAGMQLLAHGAIDIYAARGSYQLVVQHLRPFGAGSLHQTLEELKARLRAEGLLAAARKRPLPPFPQTMAVVTSLAGAAVRDICAIFRRDVHRPGLILVPAQVQGEGAEASICEALAAANARPEVDLIIVCRGGGSTEDLWCFNAESVARAIAASRAPVISAVGHETDYTLADLAADLRVPTPTAAAEIVAAQRLTMIRRLGAAGDRLGSVLSLRLATARARLEGLERRPSLVRPEWVVETRRQRVDDLEERIRRAAESCLTRWQHRLALSAGRLESVSPLATLARGYALVQREEDGRLVTRTEHVTSGDAIRVRVSNGELNAEVF